MLNYTVWSALGKFKVGRHCQCFCPPGAFWWCVCVGGWTYAREVFVTLRCVHINSMLGTQPRSFFITFTLSTKGSSEGVTLEFNLKDPCFFSSFCRIQCGVFKMSMPACQGSLGSGTVFFRKAFPMTWGIAVWGNSERAVTAVSFRRPHEGR